MKSLHRTATTAVLALAFVLPAFAQEQQAQEPQAQEPPVSEQQEQQVPAAGSDGLADVLAVAAAEDASAGVTGLPAQVDAVPVQAAGQPVAPEQGGTAALLGAVAQLAVGATGDAANDGKAQVIAQALDGAPQDSVAAGIAGAVADYAAACAAKTAAYKACGKLGGLKGIACRAAAAARFRQTSCPGE